MNSWWRKWAELVAEALANRWADHCKEAPGQDDSQASHRQPVEDQNRPDSDSELPKPPAH